MMSLVTGATGFIGSHLIDYLLARGDAVVALQRKGNASRGRLKIVEGDVLDGAIMADVIRDCRPQEIYHLAGQSQPTVSWDSPWLTYSVNVGGVLNLLEAVRAAGASAAIVIASSSAIYAQKAGGAPIGEDDTCRPASPYGGSKMAADHLAWLYAERYGLRVLRARPFFLIGPRKTGDVCSDWGRNIVAIERGLSTELAVGSLDITRDFLHVEDGVRALATIAALGEPGQAYNICSGRGWSLNEVLAKLTGLALVDVVVRQEPARVRPIDERVKVGDCTRLQGLGWSEQRGVDVALREILQYWRNHP